MTDTITVRFLGSERTFSQDDDDTSNIYWHSLGENDNEFVNLLEEGPGWWSAHICVGEKDANFADYFAHGDSAQDAASKLEARMMPLARLLAPMVREPSKSLLHELFPDLDKEDEIEMPDAPLPAGIFLPASDDDGEAGSADLLGTIRTINHIAYDARDLDPDHQTECHAETVPSRYLESQLAYSKEQRDTDASELAPEPMGGEF